MMFSEKSEGLVRFSKQSWQKTDGWVGLAHTRKFEPVIYPWHFRNLSMANIMVLQKHRPTSGFLRVNKDFSMDFN